MRISELFDLYQLAVDDGNEVLIGSVGHEIARRVIECAFDEFDGRSLEVDHKGTIYKIDSESESIDTVIVMTSERLDMFEKRAKARPSIAS